MPQSRLPTARSGSSGPAGSDCRRAPKVAQQTHLSLRRRSPPEPPHFALHQNRHTEHKRPRQENGFLRPKNQQVLSLMGCRDVTHVNINTIKYKQTKISKNIDETWAGERGSVTSSFLMTFLFLLQSILTLF